MNDATKRLSEPELREFFQQLFPNGFAGTDVVQEIAPDGWVKSPLLACHHPPAGAIVSGTGEEAPSNAGTPRGAAVRPKI